MLDELEALVGHVFIVGGRAVSAAPPGALVELPPKKPQRGREQDTFFALVTSARGSAQAQATLYEQLAGLAAEYYFRSSGGVTSGLREAITAVNARLLEHSEAVGRYYQIHALCFVLRGREVYTARTGGCICLLQGREMFSTQPEDLSDEDAVNGLALGDGPTTDIKLSRHEVEPEDVMLLADAGLARVDREKLRTALGGANIQVILEMLKPLGGKDAQAMIVEFVSVDSPDPAIVSMPANARARTNSTPVPQSVPSPTPTSTPVVPRSSKAKPLTISVPAASAPKLTAVPSPTQAQTPETVEALPSISKASTPTEELPPVEGFASSPALQPSVRPVRTSEQHTEETAARADRAGRQAIGTMASGLGLFARGARAILDRVLPEPTEENGPRIPAMLAAALAILVPVVVVFIVVALRLSQVDMTQFEQAVRGIESVALDAEKTSANNVEQSRVAWLGVLQRIDDVERNSGRTNDPILARIRAKAQGILDTYDKVTRRTATPLRSFAEGAKLVGPILRSGTDLYTLDLAQGAIYLDKLNPAGNALFRRNNQPIVQKGQATSSFVVRQLIDIVWISEGGGQRNNSLAALDRQGILVTYSPTFQPATAQKLGGSDQWVKPVAIATWRRNLYVLDPGANQIWRYVPAGSTYSDVPEEYFTGKERPNLKDAVDFDIDSPGKVYILFTNGTIRKYTTGFEEPFAFSGLPEEWLKSATAMHLDSTSSLPAIYILDALDQSVYQVTLSGTFKYRFRASDPGAFRQLTGIYADRDNIYVASGNTIYQLTMGDLLATPTPGP